MFFDKHVNPDADGVVIGPSSSIIEHKKKQGQTSLPATTRNSISIRAKLKPLSNAERIQ